MGSRFGTTVLKLAVEYLMLTLPVAAYVGIESLHKGDFGYFWTSPEWSVATLFVMLQTYRVYTESMNTRTSRRFADLLLILLVSLSFALALNIYLATDMHEPTWPILATKWVLFLVCSVIYVYIAGAAIYMDEKGRS